MYVVRFCAFFVCPNLFIFVFVGVVVYLARFNLRYRAIIFGILGAWRTSPYCTYGGNMVRIHAGLLAASSQRLSSPKNDKSNRATIT